jgi:RND family efflux transporter MFP subunit
MKSILYRTDKKHLISMLIGCLVSYLPFLPLHAEELNRLTISPAMSTEYLNLYANVEPINQATIYAQTSGVVKQINVDVNDVVKKGALLMVLDDQQQLATLLEAKAALSKAKANQYNAQKQYNRTRKLVAQRSLPQAKLDDAQAQLDAANAQIQQLIAAKDRAQEQLSYTRIVAPYSGIVTARHIEVGELALPGKSLISGFSLTHLRLTASIPEINISKVRQAKSLIADLGKGKSLTLSHFILFPYADPKNHSFTLRAPLPEDITGLSPGMFVKLAIPLGETKSIWIPHRSVLTHNELNAVYLIGTKGQVQLQQVRIGQRKEGQLQIIAGLSTGDQIIQDPHAYLARLMTEAR